MLFTLATITFDLEPSNLSKPLSQWFPTVFQVPMLYSLGFRVLTKAMVG